MARATRIALDLALVSLRKVGPVFGNIWLATKNFLINTPVKPLVCNSLVDKAESAFIRIANMLVSKLITLRNSQLPGEVKYLEKELKKVKKKMDQKGDSASKSLKPICAVAWRYAKVEMIPPNSQGFFHGPGGKKLEENVSNFADNFIKGLEGKIRDIEAEKIRQIKAKEAAIHAAQERVKAIAKAREEEKQRREAAKKELEAKKAKEKAEKEKKAEVKAETKTEKPKASSSKPKKVQKKEVKKGKNDPKAKK